MLRSFTIIFILFAFTAQTFNRAVILFDYYVNSGSFAKNCENKAKPAMHCNGKCQVMKQMKNEEKKDQQNPERRLENKNEVISSKSFFASYLCFLTASANSYNSYYSQALSAAEPKDIFHPPAELAWSLSIS